MKTYLIQITSGRGPEECARVVAKVLEKMLKEARAQRLEAETVETVPGPLNGTLLSALIQVKGKDPEPFIGQWQGTVQWIAQSPYRKFHKRKNWYVGVQSFEMTQTEEWDARQVTCESMRASGPGGQHMNKTESAIRAKHLPSGIGTEIAIAEQDRSAGTAEGKSKAMADARSGCPHPKPVGAAQRTDPG